MTIEGEDIGVASGDVFYPGTDLDVRFTVTDDETGVPIDLDGATIRWRVFPIPRGPTIANVSSVAVISKTLVSGIEVTSADGGRFTAALVPIDTQSLAGWHFHRADVVLANGKKYVSSTGRFLVTVNGAL
jgi:hypothetical protein